MEPWRILVVDDDEQIARLTASIIRNDPLATSEAQRIVNVETSFEKALELVASAKIDLIVLDVRDQGLVDAPDGGHSLANPTPTDNGTDETAADTGLVVFNRIRERRFVPVIFHTALPNLVDQQQIRAPFVQVVSKNDPDSSETLRGAVRAVLGSSLPAIHRALNDHVEAIVREFMSNFVELHWGDLQSPKRRGDLAHLLLRRLALSLDGGGDVLASRLSDAPGVDLMEDHVHPMRFYIMPPIGNHTTGDILRRSGYSAPEEAGDLADMSEQPPQHGGSGPGPTSPGATRDTDAAGDQWYVVLTPACDLVPTHLKAEYVVLAQCELLDSTPEFKAWVDTRPAPGEKPTRLANQAEKALARLMANRRDERPNDRDFFLPAAWSVPNLVVDFQKVSSVPVESLTAEYDRLATLDSPYVEALVETFSRYLGRRGTPDLDVQLSVERLRPPADVEENSRTATDDESGG